MSVLPARAGVGFKEAHFAEITSQAPAVGFFEVHAENYMGAGGPPHARLARLRRDHALSIHGVGLSIGGSAPLDHAHLARLKALVERYEPAVFSEHLAWSSHGGNFLNDLLPLPYNAATLQSVVDHVDQTQDALGRRILLENPATYLRFATSTWSEVEFLSEVTRRTGCGLLLDVNNAYVSAVNHGFDPADYIDAFPIRHVEEIHLAGFFEDEDEIGAPLLIDAHCAAVSDPVWELYARALSRRGPIATLIEWDNNIPSWPTLLAQARRADGLLVDVRQAGEIESDTRSPAQTRAPDFDRAGFSAALRDPSLPPPEQLVQGQDGPPLRRFSVHRNNLVISLIDALGERFPVTLRLVGEEFFRAMAQSHVSISLPRTPMLADYGEDFADFVAGFEPARELPYLTDIVRLEYAIGRAYHAADAAPLALERLRALLAGELWAATVTLHPSTQLVVSDFPIVSIWRANMQTREPPPLLLDHPESALVVRARQDVAVHALPAGGAAFIRALINRVAIREAVGAAAERVPDFDLTATLSALLAGEAFVAVDMPHESEATASASLHSLSELEFP